MNIIKLWEVTSKIPVVFCGTSNPLDINEEYFRFFGHFVRLKKNATLKTFNLILIDMSVESV